MQFTSVHRDTTRCPCLLITTHLPDRCLCLTGGPTENRLWSRFEMKPDGDFSFTPHFGLNSDCESVILKVGECVDTRGCYHPAVVAKTILKLFADTREVTRPWETESSPDLNPVVSGTGISLGEGHRSLEAINSVANDMLRGPILVPRPRPCSLIKKKMPVPEDARLKHWRRCFSN